MQCKCLTTRGYRCRLNAVKGYNMCTFHLNRLCPTKILNK